MSTQNKLSERIGLQSVLTFKFFYNSSFSRNFWQNPASIDVQWVATIEFQCWQYLPENDELKKTWLTQFVVKQDEMKTRFVETILGNWLEETEPLTQMWAK